MTEIVWRFTTENFDCVVLEEDTRPDPMELGQDVADAINRGQGVCVNLSAEVRSRHGSTWFGRAGRLQVVQPIERDDSGLLPDYFPRDPSEQRDLMRAAITHARETLDSLGGLPNVRLRKGSHS